MPAAKSVIPDLNRESTQLFLDSRFCGNDDTVNYATLILSIL